MAKSAKSIPVGDGIDKDLLKQIVDATNATPDGFVYVSQVQGQPMLSHNPPLIVVNTGLVNPNDGTQCAARALPAANDYLAAASQTAPVAASNGTGNYQIITGAVLPEPKKRGNQSGSGAPTKYPFADLPIGGMFFSANTEHAKGDAVKALGSTVSAQNDKYSKQKMENGVGVTKTVTRAVRDKQTKKAQVGPDGKKVTETVALPVKEYERKFTIRPVEAGKQYGSWTAPADGALVARTV